MFTFSPKQHPIQNSKNCIKLMAHTLIDQIRTPPPPPSFPGQGSKELTKIGLTQGKDWVNSRRYSALIVESFCNTDDIY